MIFELFGTFEPGLNAWLWQILILHHCKRSILDEINSLYAKVWKYYLSATLLIEVTSKIETWFMCKILQVSFFIFKFSVWLSSYAVLCLPEFSWYWEIHPGKICYPKADRLHYVTNTMIAGHTEFFRLSVANIIDIFISRFIRYRVNEFIKTRIHLIISFLGLAFMLWSNINFLKSLLAKP